ncbi:MAG: class I adenylate-forming enzyme family protein [Rhizomicrobium sp.]
MCAAALARDAAMPAVEYEGRWYGWGELRRVADRVCNLLEQSGIEPNAPVIFVPRNCPSALATLFALMSQGRTIRMVYAFQSPAGIARNIERLKSPMVIAAPQDFSPEVKEALRAQGIAGIAVEDMDAHAVPGFERARPDFVADTPLEPQIEILTSGTTGPPKQFPISYAMIATYLAGTNLMVGGEKDYSQEPPFALFMPLGNISGIYSTVPTMLKGLRVVLFERFSLEKWHDYVRRYQPVASGVPPAAVQMLLDANIPPEDISSIKTMGIGAAPLDPTVHRAFEERYNIPILLSYGATEFGGPVTAMTADLHAHWGKAKFGSVGRTIGGAQLRIIDPETEEVLRPGQEGILEVISPRIGPGWIRTSDIAVIDEDGFLFHRGRADGAIMRGGFKILPETIERALLLHPAVSAAGVVGVADKRLSQVPGAAIQLRPESETPSIAELESHLRQHVLATHIPVHWRFVDALPKTLSFKVDRPAVKRLFDAEEDG